MSEVIADLPYAVGDPEGREFFVSVVGRQRLNGTWEGWLEFVPLGDTEPLITPTETTQSSLAALQHWASALDETYVQGAFPRAVPVSEDVDAPRLAARAVPLQAVPLNDVDVPDPFQLFKRDRRVMRIRLNALSRPILLNIIDTYRLNPAAKSVSWLNDRQLVTFIVTAVEAQIAMGKG